ncbi:MAG: ion transporter [Phycisphaerales bacterium]
MREQASNDNSRPPLTGWRKRLNEVIFGVDSPTGRAFDVLLLWLILLSVLAVMLESVASVRLVYGNTLRIVEWAFTLLFTVEYALRLMCSPRPLRYARSFYGIVDLLAILPTYLSMIIGGAQSLAVIRALRLLRIFRVLKLVNFVQDANVVVLALRNSRRKITAFLGTIVIIALIVGTLMYLIEGGENSGFTSIPRSMYWAIVTVTTVGYGDIAPETNLGQMLAAALMIAGYSIIAVPTGIVSVEMANAQAASLAAKSATMATTTTPTAKSPSPRICSGCATTGHREDARFCHACGHSLE